MSAKQAALPANSEWLTRRKLIDPQLTAAGWKIVSFDPAITLAGLDCSAVVEYPTDNGPSDYALCVGGKILGIVEAKKLSLGPQNVLTQDERYSMGASANPLHFGPYHVPFLYSTNGEIIWHHDIRHDFNRSRPYQGGGFFAPFPDKGRAGEGFAFAGEGPAFDLLFSSTTKTSPLLPEKTGTIPRKPKPKYGVKSFA